MTFDARSCPGPLWPKLRLAAATLGLVLLMSGCAALDTGAPQKDVSAVLPPAAPRTTGIETSENAEKTQLANTMNEQIALPPDLELDYSVTVDMIQMLTDIRLSLLAFVPTVAGFAVAFLGKTPGGVQDSFVALGLGLLGFIVTLGVVLYDLRNSQLYNASMHRAKWLEHLLGLPRANRFRLGAVKAAPDKTGGTFTERPFLLHKIFNRKALTAKHDSALALIYGASLGGWTYVTVQGFAIAWRGNK